jgi:hypothetical protein
MAIRAPSCNRSKQQRGSRRSVNTVGRATYERAVKNDIYGSRVVWLGQSRYSWDSTCRNTKKATAVFRLSLVLVATLPRRAAVIVGVHRTMLVLHVQTMVIVSQTVSRYGTARECKRDRRRNAAKRVQRGKAKCQPHTQSFRDRAEHKHIFWVQFLSTAV